MYIKISFLSKKNIANSEKKKYIDSLFHERVFPIKYGEINQGFLHKFNNAIGFKDVVGYYNNHNAYVVPKVSSPKTYISPEELLKESMRIDFDDRYIVTFMLEIKDIEHPIKRFSYNTEDMVLKLERFAKKVYPDLEFFVEKVNLAEEITYKEFILRDFVVNFYDGVRYKIEVYLDEPLNKDDLDDVSKILNSISSRKLEIEQSLQGDSSNEYIRGRYCLKIKYLK